MTQVVRPLHQFKGKLIEGERGLTCSAPRCAVRRGIDAVPSRVTKHASIRRHTKAFYVFAEHADEDRRNRDRSCGLGRTSQLSLNVRASLSRPGARCRDCSRSVSPDLSPNPPCASQRNGLSTVSAVRRGSQGAMGWGLCWPGIGNG